MIKYETKEVWKVSGIIEHHSMPTNNPEKYIKDWIEGWEDSCSEEGYKIVSIKTDGKTFARVSINTPWGNDVMKLKFQEVSQDD